ncbi:MAG: PAS domain-containing sensor histidine kinase [Pseudomonadota bacterium]
MSLNSKQPGASDIGDGGAARTDGAAPSAAMPTWALSNTAAAAALTGAGVVAFFTTWFLMSPLVERVDRSFLMAMIIGNVVIAAGFALLVGFRLFHVWSDRRHRVAGARTHLQLAGLFSAVAVIPSAVAFLFAFTILRVSLNDVFSERMDDYVQNAIGVSNTYFQEQANDAGVNIEQIAFDLNQRQGLVLFPIQFRRYLSDQAFVRGLAGIVVMDGERRMLSQAKFVDAQFNLPSPEVFDQVDKTGVPGAPARDRGNFDLNDTDKIDMFRTLYKTDDFNGGYILTYKVVSPVMSERLIGVRDMLRDWESAKLSRSRLERVFLAGYIVLAVIILFGAIWLALWAATRIVRPIGRLVTMAERVSGGALDARVEVHKEDGELGALARAMNHMTAQLQTQRDDLIDTNRQFDNRRRFTEAVLSGVSAGVVGVGADRRITIANKSAAELLGEDTSRLTGAEIASLAPEISDLLEAASRSPFQTTGEQIDIVRQGRILTLNVRIEKDVVEGAENFVVTFDDITQLISAQRNAAWGDVARRIAHEIKNPLTPIQLSAERLRRKYQDEVVSNPEVFDRCTETIIRQVKDIGHMVNEFSSFARMPKPKIEQQEVRELIQSAVFPQKVAFPEIDYRVETPDAPVLADCDGRLIVQAITNLLKNAGESVSARVGDSQDTSKGVISVILRTNDESASIDIIDNGVGLPESERHRLAEPYMTTREKGTGLGLAIVKKVVEEHGGVLEFHDDHSLGDTGARVVMTLPLAVAKDRRDHRRNDLEDDGAGRRQSAAAAE